MTFFYEPLKVMIREKLEEEVIYFILENFKNLFLSNKDFFIKFI